MSAHCSRRKRAPVSAKALRVLVLLAVAALSANGPPAQAQTADVQRALATFESQYQQAERALTERFGSDLSAKNVPPRVTGEWSEIKRLRQSLGTRGRQLRDRASDIQSKQSALRVRQRNLTSSKSDLGRKQQALQREFAALAIEAGKCLADIKAHGARRPGPRASAAAVQRYNEEARRLQRRYNPLAARRTQLQGELANLKNRSKQLDSEQRDLSARDKELSRRRAALQTDLAAFRRACDAAGARAMALSKTRKPSPEIGAAAAVTGTVTAQRPEAGSPVRRVHSGSVLYYGDDISTDAEGRMQILLLDETVFTVGPDTELTLDKFVYDPFTETGKITATLTQGAIKFISGRIAAKTPENVTIKLPVGSLGIRGTAFIVTIGEGGRNRIDVLRGRVEFTSGKDGRSVMISRGERLRVDGDGTIGRKTRIGVERVERGWDAAAKPASPADDDSDDDESEQPPFKLVHYVIGAVAVVILLAAMAGDVATWHMMLAIVVTGVFMACIKMAGMVADAWWWWAWWWASALAGYVVFCILVVAVIVIADGLADLLHCIWFVLIVLGLIVAAVGFFFAYEGLDVLVRYISLYVWPRLRFVEQQIHREVSPGGRVMMLAAWVSTGAGVLALIGGVRLATIALCKHQDNWTPPEDDHEEDDDRHEEGPDALDNDSAEDNDDYVDAGDQEAPPCAVCGELFGESRISQCPWCRQSVHRETCLSYDMVSGGRLCNTCSQERRDSDESAEPDEGESYFEGAAPPAATASEPGRASDSTTSGPALTCPVCGEVFAGGRKSRCAQCRRVVHRAPCLSWVRVSGGRLCKECSPDHDDARPAMPEAPSDEPAPIDGPTPIVCPYCGSMVPSGDRTCWNCDSLLSPVGPSAAAETEPTAPTATPESTHQLTGEDPPRAAETPSGDDDAGLAPETESQDEPAGAGGAAVSPDIPEDPDQDAAAELTEHQRAVEIGVAVGRLAKLGTAAAHQYALGNSTGYDHIQAQIVAVGKRLMDLGGIGLVDAAYHRFERAAGGLDVREVTLAWKGGLPGWTM